VRTFRRGRRRLALVVLVALCQVALAQASGAVAPAGAAASVAPAVAAAPATPPARAEAQAWTVALDLPPVVRAGEAAVALVLLGARAGHHVNLEYPASFRPDGAATARFSGPRVALAVGQRLPCAGRLGETCQVTLALPFTPGAGPVRISGTVAFSVCTAERCLIEKVALAVGAPVVSSRTAASPR
jgi:hypothetical protein